MEKYSMIFDTETTDLEKCFCYDVGYVIIDNETRIIEKANHFIIEQVWHNLPLFESAYYKEKRNLYVKLLRARKATMTKWGYAVQEMIRDIKKYDIQSAYAYNSNFDEKVFNFNCDWYKTKNPFDTVEIYDIWGYASQFITNREDYKQFCEDNDLFTDSGNYSGNAENVYRFIHQNMEFKEDHMGLSDAMIETEILFTCIDLGAELATSYKVNKILTRPRETPFVIKINNNIIFEGDYVKKYVKNNIYNFTIRE